MSVSRDTAGRLKRAVAAGDDVGVQGHRRTIEGGWWQQVTMSVSRRPTTPQDSNMTKEQYMAAVEATKEYIQAGDIFQLVLSQRFRRRTFADPFEVYRCILFSLASSSHLSSSPRLLQTHGHKGFRLSPLPPRVLFSTPGVDT
jgi:chorismate binding enzyme